MVIVSSESSTQESERRRRRRLRQNAWARGKGPVSAMAGKWFQMARVYNLLQEDNIHFKVLGIDCIGEQLRSWYWRVEVEKSSVEVVEWLLLPYSTRDDGPNRRATFMGFNFCRKQLGESRTLGYCGAEVSQFLMSARTWCTFFAGHFITSELEIFADLQVVT